MVVHVPSRDDDPVTRLETLAADLRARGFGTTLIAPPGKAPWLDVRNPAAAMLAETVLYARGWYWWPWADRIAPAADTAAAAARVASVLGYCGQPAMNGDTEALADIVRLWGRWYVIRCISDVYHAERRDNGAAYSTPDLGRLAREIAEDYRVCPVRLPSTWDRAAWEQHLKAAGLHPGVLATALALASQADSQGVAALGNSKLAALSGCTPGTVSGRLFRLRLEGLIRREGIARGGMRSYRLVVPITPDVGQALQGNAAFS